MTKSRRKGFFCFTTSIRAHERATIIRQPPEAFTISKIGGLVEKRASKLHVVEGGFLREEVVR